MPEPSTTPGQKPQTSSSIAWSSTSIRESPVAIVAVRQGPVALANISQEENPVPTVEASFTDPDAIRRLSSTGTWFLTGVTSVDESSIDALIATGDAEHFCRANRDALVVYVEHDNASASRLHAWRAIFSGRELFFTVRQSRDVIVSDHFVNVLAAIPPRDRLPDDNILVAHYLFRKPYGTMTYSQQVTRLAHAEHLEIDLETGQVETSQFDKISDEGGARPAHEYVEAVGGALERSFTCTNDRGPSAVMFSGGVDSTLMMTYADESVTPITFVPDTPEFNIETQYARHAASLLGVEIEEIPRAETGFLDLFEIATDLVGTPVFDDAIPYLGGLIHEQPYESFYSGEGADSAFGMSLKLARFASVFRFPGVRHGLQATAHRVPGSLGYRMRQVRPIASGFAKDALDPDGFAGNARTFGDTSLFESLVTTEVVRQAKTYQLEYVTQRIALSATRTSAFLAHTELAHWVMLLANPSMIERLVAHASGKRVWAPFLDGDVLTELARIPIEDRYVRGLRSKWILKDLLAKRLPGYPTNQRKRATALPFERFYTSGPLTNFWDHYDVPDIFEGEERDALVSEPSTTTWNAITYAVWEQRVAKNPNLQPLEATAADSFAIRSG